MLQIWIVDGIPKCDVIIFNVLNYLVGLKVRPGRVFSFKIKLKNTQTPT